MIRVPVLALNGFLLLPPLAGMFQWFNRSWNLRWRIGEHKRVTSRVTYQSHSLEFWNLFVQQLDYLLRRALDFTVVDRDGSGTYFRIRSCFIRVRVHRHQTCRYNEENFRQNDSITTHAAGCVDSCVSSNAVKSFILRKKALFITVRTLFRD